MYLCLSQNSTNLSYIFRAFLVSSRQKLLFDPLTRNEKEKKKPINRERMHIFIVAPKDSSLGFELFHAPPSLSIFRDEIPVINYNFLAAEQNFPRRPKRDRERERERDVLAN